MTSMKKKTHGTKRKRKKERVKEKNLIKIAHRKLEE